MFRIVLHDDAEGAYLIAKPYPTAADAARLLRILADSGERPQLLPESEALKIETAKRGGARRLKQLSAAAVENILTAYYARVPISTILAKYRISKNRLYGLLEQQEIEPNGRTKPDPGNQTG